ncbi:MAG: hypothetical protein K2X91_11215, partial [Thermoleophilia bacterium]|nr:hypothetical protein [Thermoleophilia bacterium]
MPTEGQMLAEWAARTWAGAADRLASTYAAPPADPEAAALRLQYAHTLADLTALCIDWRADGRRPELTEEVLAFLHAVTPFLDETALLAAARSEEPRAAPDNLNRLVKYTSQLLGWEPSSDRALTQHERGRVVNGLAVELLISHAYAAYTANKDRPNAAGAALEYVERARKLDDDNLTAQICGAQFYLLGGYLDEAEAMLARAQRSPQAKSEALAERLDGYKKMLDERRKAKEKGKQREEPTDAGTGVTHTEEVAALEREIERFPSAVQGYEELVRSLAAGGRFDEAAEWCALAVARCSARDAQVRARTLDLETLGLRQLAARDQNAVRLYLVGVH